MSKITTNLIEISSVHFEPGYWRGISQPSVLVSLRLTRLEIAVKAVRRFDELMTADSIAQAFGRSSGLLLDPVISKQIILSRVLKLALVTLDKIGMPVMGGATAIKSDEKNPLKWVVGLPAIAQGITAPQASLSLACNLINSLADGKNVKAEDLTIAISKIAKHFQPMAPKGINTLRFLQAAHEQGIPWRHVANNVYQFGWGSGSRWLDSSFTDETSTISAGLARDKVACAKVLRNAGLPVPRHQLVGSAEQAVKVADALGYPVVVKPANLDGGAGVMAELCDAEAVNRAFSMAIKLSKRILVEEFIVGEDYRIRICSGEIIGAVIRKAAAVIGDGKRSVRALISHTNAERAKQTQQHDMETERGVKPIELDEEVQSWLTKQGLTLESVVPQGHKVKLRGAANVNLGGTTWDVTDGAHPDNLELALRAVAALRLDVAGVDLLLPDIGQSWRSTGGVVCEVNAKPQFSTGDAHRKVLKKLLPHRGRIPVVGVLNDCLNLNELQREAQRLNGAGLRVEIAMTARACHQALMCTRTDALIWIMSDFPATMVALPIDEIDVLIFTEEGSHRSIPAQWVKAEQWMLIDSAGDEQMINRLSTYMLDHCQQHN